jgi:hypothetical protein
MLLFTKSTHYLHRFQTMEQRSFPTEWFMSKNFFISVFKIKPYKSQVSFQFSDLMQNALIVPLKILKGHEIVKNVGVTCCKFHPNQPWLFTCGADSTIKLYSN